MKPTLFIPPVTEYLDGIKATPTERTVCVEQAAESRIRRLAQDRKVSREEILRRFDPLAAGS